MWRGGEVWRRYERRDEEMNGKERRLDDGKVYRKIGKEGISEERRVRRPGGIDAV